MKSIPDWHDSVLVATYNIFIRWKSTHSAHWSYDPVPLQLPLWPWCCKSKGCDNYCRTENLTQSTWTNSPKFDGKLLWFHSYENFCKSNFCNDHVITKITKILYYEKLELYGMLFTETKYLKVAVSIEMQVLFKKNTIQP